MRGEKKQQQQQQTTLASTAHNYLLVTYYYVRTTLNVLHVHSKSMTLNKIKLNWCTCFLCKST